MKSLPPEPHPTMIDRRRFLKMSAALGASAALSGLGDCCWAQETDQVRFGITADPHVRSPGSQEDNLRDFVDAMTEWKADFIIDLGDFAVQIGEGPTTKDLHDGQLANLRRTWGVFSSGPSPAYLVMGNHDAGWIKGGDESVAPEDLYAEGSAGEDITNGGDGGQVVILHFSGAGRAGIESA